MTCMRLWIGLIALGLLAVAGPAPARADDAPAPAAVSYASYDQAKAAFDRQFTAYKDSLREVERLRAQFQTADDPTRARINDELNQQVATMQKTVAAMVTAATETYQLAPNRDPAITNLLLAVVSYDIMGQQMSPPMEGLAGADRYEHALPIINVLAEGGADQPLLPVWGFLSAISTNDYDRADKYRQMMQQSGVLMNASLFPDETDKELRNKVLNFLQLFDQAREKWNKEAGIRAKEAEADDLPRVRFSTTKGDITLELFEDQAPQTVANFITLVKQGYYDGVAFHRVIPWFMAQGGDPKGDGTGGPGYLIRDECYGPDARMHFRGSLSMAHGSSRDSGGSQFFITVVPTPHLDGLHTVFGRVVDGMEVVPELQRREPTGNPARDAMLPPPDRILKAEVLRDRGHEYTFDRLPDQP